MRRMVTNGSIQERRSAPVSLSINSQGCGYGDRSAITWDGQGDSGPRSALCGGRQGGAITTSLPAVRIVRLTAAGVDGLG